MDKNIIGYSDYKHILFLKYNDLTWVEEWIESNPVFWIQIMICLGPNECFKLDSLGTLVVISQFLRTNVLIFKQTVVIMKIKETNDPVGWNIKVYSQDWLKSNK